MSDTEIKSGGGLRSVAVTSAGLESRSLRYLAHFKVLVVGEGTVATTAAGILSTLGARVARAEAGDVDRAALGGYDAVLCDRVEVGCDDTYFDQVARGLAALGPLAPTVWVTASAFGLTGAARAFKGSDLVCAAAGGLLAAIFDDEGHVYPVPGVQALQTVGHLMALAAIHGVILARQRSEAVHIDLSAQEAVAFCTNQQTPSHVLHKCGVPAGVGRYSAPSGPFPCVDGQVQIIVVDDHQFARFAEAIERPEWIPIFVTVADRVASADMIDTVTAEWSSVRSKLECEEFLQGRGVAATAVRSVNELLDSTQFQARHWPDPRRLSVSPVVLPALVTAAQVENSDRTTEVRAMADLHVIEVSNVLAGPLTGAILGALGAEVVRVEGTERLDLYRQNGPFAGGIAGLNRGAYFQGANYCKRSVTEAVAHENGSGAWRWADVLVENVGQKRVEQVGVRPTPRSPAEASMSLSISAFGRTGPCAGFRGYAQNVHAFAGLEDAILGVTGHPVTMRTVLADYASAVWAATVVSAWWLSGTVDTERVDMAMTEVVAGRMLRPDIAIVPGSGPGVKDIIVDVPGVGHLAVSGQAQDWVQRITAAIGVAGQDGNGSVTEDGVVQRIREVATIDAEEAVRTLQEAGVAAYLARTPEGLIADYQLSSRQFFMRLDHPEIDDSFFMTLPWEAVGEPRAAWYRRAPLLGEDDEWARQEWKLAGATSGGSSPPSLQGA